MSNSTEEFFRQYGGWLGFVGYFIYNRLFPFFSSRYMGEQDFRHKMEIRQAESLDRISEAITVMTTAMALNNERLSLSLSNQNVIISMLGENVLSRRKEDVQDESSDVVEVKDDA